MKRLTLVVVGFSCILWASVVRCQEPDSVEKDYSSELPRIQPLSPEQSQTQFDVAEGFEISLVACEPLVVDPVAFAFDGKGRLWVVEMRDYSEQDQERLGRVAVLEDTDGDGVMDKRTTFVEGLSWPTAIWPWLDGAIIADAPNLTWYRDTDGDLVADKRGFGFYGFGRSNVQGLVNSFRWGVDGNLHGATSSSGAKIEYPTDAHTFDLGRRDFRVDTVNHQIHAEAGGGQHGMCFNRWGDKFVTSNSDHLQQIVDLESWLNRQSHVVAFPAVRRSIAEDGPQAEVFRSSPIEPWRIVRTRLRVSGVTPGVVEGGGRAAGYFTGATGTCVLDCELGFGVPGEPYDTAIVCDVGSNLVHRKRLIDQGLYYSGQRIDQQSEFVRSTDIWFRPVQIGEGPDGALYIADMYREVIEHPASLPPVIKKHLDLTSGRDRGRIWRVTPQTATPTKLPKTCEMPIKQLVKELNAPGATRRLLAAQTFLERHSLDQLEPHDYRELERFAFDQASPAAQVIIFNLLGRFGRWNRVEIVQRAMESDEPRVLACAIRMLEQYGFANLQVETICRIAEQTQDSRLLIALGEVSAKLTPENRQRLLKILIPKSHDPLVRAVVATAAGADWSRLLQSPELQSLDDATLQQWLSLWLPVHATGLDTGCKSALGELLAQSLRVSNSRQQVWIAAVANLPSHQMAAKALQLEGVQTAIDTWLTNNLSNTPTVSAIHALRLGSPDLQAEWLAKLLSANTDQSVQQACIESLSWSDHPSLPQTLVDNFSSFTPALQQLALRTLASRPARMPILLKGLQSQQIARSQVSADIRQILFAQKDAELANKFKLLLNQASSDRQSVIDRYAKTIDEQSDANASAGQAVFERVCAQCHRLGQLGNDVGPPLKQLGQKSPAQLLEAVLDPSREVDPKYLAYTFLLDDGVVLNGIIVQDSGQQIVVGEAGGKQTTLDRSSIDEMKSSGVSLMPNGLEEQISPDQMRDLIRFLKTQSESGK